MCADREKDIKRYMHIHCSEELLTSADGGGEKQPRVVVGSELDLYLTRPFGRGPFRLRASVPSAEK